MVREGGVLSIITGALVNWASRALAGGLDSRSDATTRKKYLPSARISASKVMELSCRSVRSSIHLRLVLAAEIDVVDQAVAIGIVGLPDDGDLLLGGARQGLRGSAGGAGARTNRRNRSP